MNSLIKFSLMLLCIQLSTVSVQAQWDLPGTFGKDIDAAFLDPTIGNMIFQGDQFVIYGDEAEATYPINSISNWPESWTAISAATSFDGKTIMLFSGSSYLTLDTNSKSITGGAVWEGLPSNWNNQIDAAVNWQPGIVYLFQGQEFIAYDSNTQQYGQVTSLATWGLPANWNNSVDAAVNIQNGSVYFFRGGEYIIYDQQAGTFSGATSINSGGGSLGFIPPPGAKAVSNNATTVSLPSPNTSTSAGGNRMNPRQSASSVGESEEEEEETSTIDDPNEIRPTGPFPDEYRDDYKAFSSQLMNITWGAATASSIRPLAAKNWIGTGVDILYVDPLKVNKSKRAPRKAILMTDSDEQAGNASEYVIPFGTKFESIGQSETVEGEKLLRTYGDFQTTFGGSIGASVEVPMVASGSASASYKQMNSSKFGTENVYGYKQASNELYKVNMNLTWIDNKSNQKYRQKLDIGFRNAIKNLKVPSTIPALSSSMKKGDKLPSSLNSVKSAYLSVVKGFGTHITESVTFGGRYITLYEISRSSYESARMDEAGFESEVAASIKGVQVGVNASFEYSSAKTSGKESENFTGRSYITGGNANNYDKWNNNVETAPAAISFELIPISSLLIKELFPNDPDIEKKAQILKAVMLEYIVNRMVEPVDVDLANNNFFRALKPLEYEYDVAIENIRCTGVDAGESGSENEFFGHVTFSCGGKSVKAWDVSESEAMGLSANAEMPVRMRDPFIITLAEKKQATLSISGHMYEEDNDTWGDGDDDMGTDSKSIKLHEMTSKPKTVYLMFRDEGDKAEVKITITKRLKIEEY